VVRVTMCVTRVEKGFTAPSCCGTLPRLGSFMRFLIPISMSIAAVALPTTGLLAPVPAIAQNEESAFQAYLPTLRAQAERQGVSRTTLDSVMPTLTFNARVVELDRDQPGGSVNAPIPNFAPYRIKHVDAPRINRGRAKYQALRHHLERIERETGVPESIMVAIYGHETGYGSVMGSFDLLRALATLAYEGRRRDLFAGEFIAGLKMIDQGVPRSRLVGSWAGATGYPQFLPSVYLRMARDGDGDGRKDIWTSEADALASIANYFVNAGWRPNVPWGVAVNVPAGLNRAALRSKINSPRCPRVHDRHSRYLSMAEWRRLGIAPVSGPRIRDTEMASLLEPDGPGKTAYLLTGNYRVILDYNCSNFYALSVGLLADEVER
jgi:membrane-bound lytic murein transglycosylase B